VNTPQGDSPLRRVLDALERVGCRIRTCPGGWQAQCPAHKDRVPSLSLRETDDGKVLLHCFSGCETQDVLGALGLTFRDLFPQTNSNRKRWRHTSR
jgi:DNA primase